MNLTGEAWDDKLWKSSKSGKHLISYTLNFEPDSHHHPESPNLLNIQSNLKFQLLYQYNTWLTVLYALMYATIYSTTRAYLMKLQHLQSEFCARILWKLTSDLCRDGESLVNVESSRPLWQIDEAIQWFSCMQSQCQETMATNWCCDWLYLAKCRIKVQYLGSFKSLERLRPAIVRYRFWWHLYRVREVCSD